MASLFEMRLRMTIREALERAAEKEIEEAKKRFEVEARNIVASMALTVSRYADIERKGDRLIIELKMPIKD